MIQAHGRNMTGSEYVYLFPYPFTRPPLFAPLKWKQNSHDDDMALNAFRSLILLTFDRDEIDNTSFRTAIERRILTRQRADNLTTPAAKLFQPTMAAYEAVMVMATVVNEVLQQHPSSFLNGTAIVERMLNRTFQLSTGAVYYSSAGQQYPDVAIKQIKPQSGLFEEVLVYDGDTFVFNVTPGKDFLWKGKGPPLNEPLCGYTGQKCLMVTSYDSVTISIIVVPLVGIACFAALSLFYFSRRSRLATSTISNWWYLEAESLRACRPLREQKSISCAACYLFDFSDRVYKPT
ncbi:hypothetical protein RvY_16827 [Ramazzottius varieornatus]|uniref:Receptor ligand binding region domain-containing protein n=1 Tax=Ramazzottius varieornatus TaxID=947166 RepID=A0A1D1W446_RAMVA|nr:hypothetical protein RvY_16827 [Ramazzottius varieornatus]